MKNFFASIPNRLKAVYLVWVFVHFVLLLIGSLLTYSKYFYPFSSNYKGYVKDPFYRTIYKTEITFNYKVYDYSEFLIYTLTPIVVYFVIKLWNKKDG